MERTAVSMGQHQVQELQTGSQDTGRPFEVHHKDQSGGKITDVVGFQECMCGHDVCGRHKAGRHNSITAITIAVTEGSGSRSILPC